MKSDSGILYHSPPKPLWLPRCYATAPQSLSVRFKTQLCDARGRVEKDLQEGWNTITDWGMDALASIRPGTLIGYLHLGSILGPAKRVGQGANTLTLTINSPSDIDVFAAEGFFTAGDVGNTLSITALGQELKIIAYTDTQHIKCTTRAGAWLPGIVPSAGPFASFGVHFTSVNVLNNQITKFNTYDTGAANYAAELNDSGNSRSIHQRIFLSGTVAGADWTINELGWSDGNAGNNLFGKVNLLSPDVVPVGKKYRVTLQLYSGQTPINIASQSVNWGATIGTYDLQIRQEVIPQDSASTPYGSWIAPCFTSSLTRTVWWTGAFAMATTKWAGDVGYLINPHGPTAGDSGVNAASDQAYTGGQHTKTRNWTIADSLNLAGLTGVCCGYTSTGSAMLITLKPNSGTITKPSGYWCALNFQLFWTRTLPN